MNRNKGYITVEASFIVPIFLFFMLGMSGIYMILMAEAHIHQSLAAAVDHVAEECYLEHRLLAQRNRNTSSLDINQIVDSLMVKNQLNAYLGKDYYIEKYIVNGTKGIVVKVERDRENPKIMLVTARYQAKLILPLLGTYSINLSNQIKQKAFVGFAEEEYLRSDYYVFITPNREAYHLRRDCTHLMLDVVAVNSNRKGTYAPCFYCGVGKSSARIFIAKNGEVYHNSRSCVGLKRSVRRVKISTVQGIGVCQRCGT